MTTDFIARGFTGHSRVADVRSGGMRPNQYRDDPQNHRDLGYQQLPFTFHTVFFNTGLLQDTLRAFVKSP